MNDEELLKFGKASIELLAKLVEKELDPLPDYRIEIKKEPEYSRPDVPFNVESPGLFVFFRKGISWRLLEPIRKPDMRVYAVGGWINALIHDLVHLYQEVSLKKIYNDDYNDEQRILIFQKYCYWSDGLAEYLAWKISSGLYREAGNEGNYWQERKNLEDVIWAIKNRQYKEGLKQRLVYLGTLYYFVLKNSGLEKWFILPKFLPEEIEKEIWSSIKRKRLSFKLPAYAEKYLGKILAGDNKVTYLFLHYALGFVSVVKIIENGGSAEELLNNPKDNKQLLEQAQINLAEL